MAKLNQPFIKFDRVSKSYDDEMIIKDLTVEIQQGEFLTILGPSGSGKSTCLMMLAGFENLTSGDIYIDGSLVTHIPAHQRNIGMVFQNYALFPHMTVAQNLAYPLKFKNHNAKEIREKVGNFLNLVQLEGFAQRYPSQLSGGQKQRVALARALIYSPKLVLMDEPLGALDKNLRDQMQYEIKKLQQTLGFTMVYVTHDQNEAMSMSDRILVLDQGIIQQLSDTKTLYRHPNNAFVASFVGESNLLNAEFVSQNDKNSAQFSINKHNFNASTQQIFTQNQAIQLFIRPENLVFSRQLSTEYNQLPSTIKAIVFNGDHYRITLTLDDGQEIIIKHQGELAQDLENGKPLLIGFLTKHCVGMLHPEN